MIASLVWGFKGWLFCIIFEVRALCRHPPSRSEAEQHSGERGLRTQGKWVGLWTEVGVSLDSSGCFLWTE